MAVLVQELDKNVYLNQVEQVVAALVIIVIVLQQYMSLQAVEVVGEQVAVLEKVVSPMIQQLAAIKAQMLHSMRLFALGAGCEGATMNIDTDTGRITQPGDA